MREGGDVFSQVLVKIRLLLLMLVLAGDGWVVYTYISKNDGNGFFGTIQDLTLRWSFARDRQKKLFG